MPDDAPSGVWVVRTYYPPAVWRIRARTREEAERVLRAALGALPRGLVWRREE